MSHILKELTIDIHFHVLQSKDLDASMDEYGNKLPTFENKSYNVKGLALFDTGADVSYICAELGVELEDTERYSSFFNLRYLSPFSVIF